MNEETEKKLKIPTAWLIAAAVLLIAAAVAVGFLLIKPAPGDRAPEPAQVTAAPEASSQAVPEPDMSETVEFGAPDAADLLLADPAHYPALKSLCITNADCAREKTAALTAAFPSAEIVFRPCKGFPDSSPSCTELDLTALLEKDAQTAAAFLECMPALERVVLTSENGTNLLTISSLMLLEQSAPQAAFDYRFELFNVPVSAESEALEFYGNSTGYIYDEGLCELEELLPALPRLKSLYFEFCEIEYDTLAAFRDRHPEIDVVWRIIFGAYSCRTDTERIFANGSLDSYKCRNLKYCNRVKYIDLGHNDDLTTIEFVRYMPDLEVGIFAAGGLQDVSPLAECQKLRYLEVFTTAVWDVSPIAACTELEHLNVSYLHGLNDITCLSGLTKLKRFWCTCNYIPEWQQNSMREALPDCEFCFDWCEPTGNYWRFNDDGSRVDYYEEIAQIFGYDNWRENISYS